MAFGQFVQDGLGMLGQRLFPAFDPNDPNRPPLDPGMSMPTAGGGSPAVDPAAARAMQQNALLNLGLGLMAARDDRQGLGHGAALAFGNAQAGYQESMDRAFRNTLLKRRLDYEQQDRDRQAKTQQREERQSAAATAGRISSALQSPQYAANPQAYWDLVKSNPDVQAALQQAGVQMPAEGVPDYRAIGSQLGAFAQASGPASAAPSTDDLKEYGFAVQQGFKGGFFDYLKQVKAAGAQQINLPSGYRWNADGTMSAIPGGPADKPKERTEADKKAGVLLQGMSDAEAQLSQIAGEDTSSVEGAVLGKLPGGGVLQSDAYRQYKSAADRWASNYLYLKSGAQAGKDEIASTAAQFFPQPGDGPDVIEQKRVARQQESASIAAAYNTAPVSAATARIIPNSQGPIRIQSDADFEKLPSGAEFIAPDGSRRRKP